MTHMYHAPITVDGHTFLVDVPFFASSKELERWYTDTVAYLRSIIKEG